MPLALQPSSSYSAPIENTPLAETDTFTTSWKGVGARTEATGRIGIFNLP